MEKSEKWMQGYLKIKICGKQCERFLNLCKARGFYLENVRRKSTDQLTAEISVNEFRKLQPIRAKTNVHIHILEKNGFPFWWMKGKKRMGLFVGILLSALFLGVLSSRIWNIHIEGNVKNSTPELLAFLDEQGIFHGIRKKQVDCGKIAAQIREHYPDITFVSVNVQGTRLLLQIQEGLQIETMEKNNAPKDLISDIDGEIVSIVVRNGTPMKKVGEMCSKGEILVSGAVELKDDNQEIIRTEYTAADADVYIRHEIAYYEKLPYVYLKKEITGNPKNHWYLHAGNWIFGTFYPKEGNFITTAEEYNWKLTENFYFPVSVGKMTRVFYEEKEETYTAEEAKKLVLNKLERYKQQLEEAEIQIEECHLTMKEDQTACVLQGTFTVIQKCEGNS